MKIINDTLIGKGIRFGDLEHGEVFYTMFDCDSAYIKTDSNTKTAVELCNGKWVDIDDDILVIPYKKAELHIEK